MIKYDPISGKIPAGYLDRRIQFYGQSTSKVQGSPKKSYAHAKTVKAHFRGLSESEAVLSGAETNVGVIEIWVRHQRFLATETETYETFRINASTTEPVYMRNLSGEVIHDLNGNPLIDEEKTITDYYEIIGIDPFVTRKRFMKILARRWR